MTSILKCDLDCKKALTTLAFVSLFTSAAACNKPPTDKTGQSGPTGDDDAFVEAQPTGSVAWNVRPSGEVAAALKTKDGQPLPAPVTGTLVWTAPGQEPQATPVAYTDGALTANGPKLTADVTELRYTIDANGSPWTGVLHLPPGGTQQVVMDAKAGAKLAVPDGKVGPHGGRIQVVGPDRLELVSNVGTGEVRVYALDDNYAPVPIGDRHVTLGVVADRSEVVALEPEPGGLYCTAVWGIDMDPWRLDASMRIGPSVYFGVWGFRPGVPLFVGPAAPRYSVRFATGWGPPVLRGHMLLSSPRLGLAVGGPGGGFHGGMDLHGGGLRGDGVRADGVVRGGGAFVGVAPRAGFAEGPRVVGPTPGRAPERAPERGGGHRR